MASWLFFCLCLQTQLECLLECLLVNNQEFQCLYDEVGKAVLKDYPPVLVPCEGAVEAPFQCLGIAVVQPWIPTF